ncbi:molybdopterin oxidoreductase family protein [Rubrivirga sp. S365]|uniref:Molybdopterin oxidoreductase family protein n=1 Tax=Rubrivirga litoralis TaxID=3075598 RepID=A0ABU3BQK3_9BACT|nr:MULTISPECIES: molybdopterin oxidoreductase family protein [unclassified Rubrivirga]MDT0631555.1 molybdopterin oxidoreductase family protein [Rubrivirga sp. F394]MDT7857190.1 molybdopterin oxidoreductase family protein [Rubrivirga sp. S365]
MPTTPTPSLDLDAIREFGPYLQYARDMRVDTGVEPDRYVKTHCCFCGQQCGMQLKVKDDTVVGVEPWYDFPFNKGMMCPKGIKRYLQQSHPDRLLHAYKRDASAPSGFSAMAYEEAIGRVAAEIDRIQAEHGKDAFSILSGASLTTEKTYLMGKFAHMALKTSNIDYNGRLCMVSAAAGNKKSFGVDRAANPWSDILGADVVWISGANVAECAPITTNYVWQAREHGAKVIVADPRITPIARTCDLFLPVKPGRDTALFNGVLHLMIENDWIDHEFVEQHTVGFDAVAEEVHAWTPQRTAEVTGVAEKSIRQAAEWWGQASTSFLMHARGIEHHSRGVQNVMSAINIVLASGRIGREHCGYGTITGQANGQGGREHGQKCDQLPGGRDLGNPEHREYVAGVWGIEPDELPQPGVDAYEIIRKIHRGEIKGLLSVCFNPVVSLPDNNYVREALEKLDFYVAIDFFLNETARYADVVLPGSLQEEDEGTVTQLEGRVIKINPAVQPPGDARQDWRIIQDIAKALGRERGLTFANPREMFEELRVASKGYTNDYSGITWERVEDNYGVFWPCPSETPEGVPEPGPQGTVRLFEPDSWNPIAQGAGPFYFPDGKARFNVTEYVGPTEDVDDEYPVILTTGRVVSQFLSGTQTRRIGPLIDHYPEPRIEMHPHLAAQLGIADGDWATAESRRGNCTLRAQVVKTIRPDTVFIPYHWAGRKSANQLTISAQDPISKIPEYKVCAVRVTRAEAPPEYEEKLQPQQ